MPSDLLHNYYNYVTKRLSLPELPDMVKYNINSVLVSYIYVNMNNYHFAIC